MRIFSGRRAEVFVRKLAARSTHLGDLEPAVRLIVNDVRRHGDRALRRYAQKWDGLSAKQSFRVSGDEMQQALKSADPELRKSLTIAAKNIRQFCEWQMPRPWTHSRNGISLGQLIQPLESVGCYVPGGRYPLVSTVLMTVIPAQVAGVRTIRVVSPNPSAEVLTAAGMLGVTEFYRIGGAQAVAALAYGTDTITRVDKIVGPGNSYVTTAKKLVSFDCAIDFLAGPTEALIMSDSGNPEFIAADLVAQAEHDVETLAWFMTTSSEMAKAVAKSVATIARENPTRKKILERQGCDPDCRLSQRSARVGESSCA